jgi:hypothetical protein
MQRAEYDALWEVTAAQWPPKALDEATFDKRTCTVIARPAGTAAAELAGITARLPEFSARHEVYAGGQLHMTVLGLGPRAAVGTDLASIERVCSDIARQTEPVPLEVEGLNILGDSLVAQVLDPTGRLAHFVASCLGGVRKDGVALTDPVGLHSRLWWWTIARLRCDAEPQLRDYVAERRLLPLGALLLRQLEIVETDKLFRPEQTRVIGRVRLGAAGRPQTSECDALSLRRR